MRRGRAEQTGEVSRGRLRIYLGAAPGVGKTFAMLNEGRRRLERGTDVVVAYVETHQRPNTLAQLDGLEVIPRKVLVHRGVALEEMDIDAVLARRPAVALVDELAHSNVPGSTHEKRWQDVQDLLDAGIDVISTVNIQHLESINDVVEQITGIRQQETVPDAVVRSADQVELVDMTPEAIRRRMAHGNIYPAERVDAALANYFRLGNLSALRELALLWLADKVEAGLQQYMADHGIEAPWETRERVVVALTGAPSGEHLVRRAARMARRSQGDLIGVHISTGEGLAPGDDGVLARHRALLADLGGDYREVVGNDVGEALLQFARSEKATQLVVGASARSRPAELLRGSVLQRVIRGAGSIDVHVIGGGTADTAPAPALPAMPSPTFRNRLPRRRVMAGWLLLAAGLPLLTTALLAVGPQLGVTSDLLIFLLLVTAAAAIGGTWPGVVGAIAASVVVNFFFVPPVHTFTIQELENALALLVFVVVAVIVSQLVSRLTARELDANRAAAEAEALARVAGGMAGDEPLVHIADHVRSTFGLVATRVRSHVRGSWVVDAVAGEAQAFETSNATVERVELGDDAVLELIGPALTPGDQRVLHAFAAQLATALERERLRRETADAEARGQADALRTAILRAVSHDLRTPLASIKASVTSLKQRDIEWPPEAEAEFLDTIDEETDRLNRLVSNLLDMSRIEAGAVAVRLRIVDVADVIAGTLAEVAVGQERIEVALPDPPPLVRGDPVLLERVLSNLVANAVRHTPERSGVRIEAATVGADVHLRVIDRGPGVRPEDRDRLFAPFQRRGDAQSDTGVGLGLAVVQGFVNAMGGRVDLEDTPGGGLTAVVVLPAWREDG